MDQQDTRKFSELMAVMAKYFGKELEPNIQRLYFEALSDLSIAEFEIAVHRALKGSKFFPKIAELLEFVEGSAEDQATIAWELLLTAIERVGFYSSLWVESAVLAQAVRATFGTWTQCCTDFHPVFDYEDSTKQVSGLTPEMIAARKKEFFGHFRIALRRDRRDSDRYFPGYHEQNNSQTIGSWKFHQLAPSIGVGVISAGQVGTVCLPSDKKTARLSEEGRALLEAGEAPRLIEAAQQERLKEIEAAKERRLLLLAESVDLPPIPYSKAISVVEGLEMLRQVMPKQFGGKAVANAGDTNGQV
jgi:hypothetical protein